MSQLKNWKKSHPGNHKSEHINSKVAVQKNKYNLNDIKNYINHTMHIDDSVKTDKKGNDPCSSDSSLSETDNSVKKHIHHTKKKNKDIGNYFNENNDIKKICADFSLTKENTFKSDKHIAAIKIVIVIGADGSFDDDKNSCEDPHSQCRSSFLVQTLSEGSIPHVSVKRASAKGKKVVEDVAVVDFENDNETKNENEKKTWA